MALMAAAGEITPMPECAVFADTHDEPKSVYKWLPWLQEQLPFEIVRVSIGKLSAAASTARRSGKGSSAYLSPGLPVFFNGGEGKGKRQCTRDFKIIPVQRYENLIRGGGQVSQWMGISTDESDRVKPARKPWITNRYPLIELNMTRLHCLEWMRLHNFPDPPRSACRYCPFHSDDEWIRLRDEEPEEFAGAALMEVRYQEAAARAGLKAIPFLHRDCVPLKEVVLVSGRGPDLFSNECEGMCGV
jgi:hypothetical protein